MGNLLQHVRTSDLLAATLRRSNIDASAGTVEEVQRIVAQIRQRWPKVRVLLRGDSGFAREAPTASCDSKAVAVLVGLARNERLQKAPDLLRDNGERFRLAARRTNIGA